MPDIEFINSQKTEEDRIKSTAKIIASGFYEKQGFVVVPALDQRVEPTSQVIYPNEFEYQVVKLDSWEREWERVGAMFWKYLEELVPSAKLHGPIEVRLSRYGTVASSAKLGMIPGEKVVYYLRSDVALCQLAGMIINKLLYFDRQSLGVTWTKREALMDFVMTRPVMRKLFPDFEPVYSSLLRIAPSIRSESENYVRSLGLVLPKQVLEVKGGKIWVKGKYEPKMFGKKEGVILKKLIGRRGDLVSYDELADSIWGEGEFKSFWALAKLVERLRKTLGVMGIDPARIESVRGQGYLLR